MSRSFSYNAALAVVTNEKLRLVTWNFL